MKRFVGAMVAAVALLVGSTVSAGTITFDLDTVYSGGTPNGTPPYLTATFEDDPNGVLVTFSALNLAASEFVGFWLFNIDPAFSDASFDAADITRVSGATAAVSLAANTPPDFSAGPSKYYDLKFDFENSSSSNNRLSPTAYTQAVYLITSPTLTPEDFNFLSSQSKGFQYSSAAHIQSIASTDPNLTSGWIADGNASDNDVPVTVPEPSSAAAAIFGLSALGLAGRFVRK
jgi:hypothetical protein